MLVSLKVSLFEVHRFFALVMSGIMGVDRACVVVTVQITNIITCNY